MGIVTMETAQFLSKFAMKSDFSFQKQNRKRKLMLKKISIVLMDYLDVSLMKMTLLQAPPQHLISAAVMSAPAVMAIAKLNYPETKESITKRQEDVEMASGLVLYDFILCHLYPCLWCLAYCIKLPQVSEVKISTMVRPYLQSNRQ